MEEQEVQKNSQRATLRNRKGWIGFVHGYKKFIDTVDWDSIEWGNGAKPKSIKKDGVKTVIKF